MFGTEFVLIGMRMAQAENELVRKAIENMTPEQYEKWKADRTAERRHRELCAAIRQAGKDASFWRVI